MLMRASGGGRGDGLGTPGCNASPRTMHGLRAAWGGDLGGLLEVCGRERDGSPGLGGFSLAESGNFIATESMPDSDHRDKQISMLEQRVAQLSDDMAKLNLVLSELHVTISKSVTHAAMGARVAMLLGLNERDKAYATWEEMRQKADDVSDRLQESLEKLIGK